MNSRRHLVLGAARSGKTRFALNVAKTLARERGSEVIYVATAEAHDAEMRERIARHRAERPTNWRTLEAPRDLARKLASIKRHEASEARAASKDAGASSGVIACDGAASTQYRAVTEAPAPAAASAEDFQSIENRAPLAAPSAEHGWSIEPSNPLATRSVVIIDCLTLWLSNALLSDFDEARPNAPSPTWENERGTFIQWLEACEHPVILVSNEVGGGIVPASALARRFQSEQGWLNQDVAALCEQVTLVVAGLPVTIKPAR